MRYFRIMTLMLLAASLAVAGCGKNNEDNSSLLLSLLGGGGTVVNIAAIPGVTPPNYGETPVTTITETAQYTGTVSWSPNDDPFAATTVYTATITLTAKSGYTLIGVAADFFTVAGATSVTNSAESGAVTAVFPATGAAPATVINIAAIPGITAPVLGATPVITITETAQYTGTVSWSPDDDPFAATTMYTATITLTAKPGYTLTGVAANFFTVAGTTSASNSADSGVVTAVFPATGAAVINIAAIPGVTTPVYGATPVTTITETAQYTGTVTWSGSPVTFAATTEYTATITLSAKPGYTLTGVTADFFTAAGATSVSNSADLGVVTAVFPATAAAAAGESGFSDATTVGVEGTITLVSQTVKMNYANNRTSITFPFSPQPNHPVNNQDATLTRKFFMGQTQVTNALFAAVLQWAKDNGKIAETGGAHNEVSATTVKYGTQELIDLDYGATNMKVSYSTSTHAFSVAGGYENHPVVLVSWYGAIMFCNWLTEMRDGNTNNAVYTGITASWIYTDTVENADRNGYRLPSSQEWEYAARYIGTTKPTAGNLYTQYIALIEHGGNGSLTNGYYWTPANYASGAIKDYSFETETRAVGWYTGDPGMGGADKLMPVAQKIANQVGLYDMSGNVWEWGVTHGAGSDTRVIRGGGWNTNNQCMQVGLWAAEYPYYEGNFVGFRFARTK